MEELWLVRHGESVGNVAATAAEATRAEVIDLATRDADVPLSATGAEQARALSAALNEGPVTPQVAWVSPYLRAQQTFALSMEHVAGMEGVAGTEHVARVERVLTDERLRDRELGILDLLTRWGVAARHPEEADRRARLGKYYHRPPGGESWADVSLRLRSFLRDALADDAGVGLVVAHDAVVMLLIALLTGMDETRLMQFASTNTVLNASVTRLRLENQQWRLLDFSDVSHLAALGADITVHPGSPDARPE